MKVFRIINLVSTGLLTVLMCLSAGMYFFNNDEVSATFLLLGFPTFIIYPLAVAKILGVIVLWTNPSKSLKEWAYAGFFFNLILALFAHIEISDGDFPGALIGLVLIFASYFSWKKWPN